MGYRGDIRIRQMTEEEKRAFIPQGCCGTEKNKN